MERLVCRSSTGREAEAMICRVRPHQISLPLHLDAFHLRDICCVGRAEHSRSVVRCARSTWEIKHASHASPQ
eukprot:6549646-Prymnesium_polylepis.3